jgi:hypothetical protein
VGEALQDYNLLPIFKKQVDCCQKMFKETKKIRNPKNNKGNDQVENKKTTTKKKTMQTQQCGK